MNFTHQNHLKYSIGGREFGYREEGHDKYKVQLGSIDPDRYAKSSYKDELHRTAQLVKDDLGKDLVVFFSGGTDSEIVLRNFLHIGMKPRCVVLKFENNYNIRDVLEAQATAKQLEIDLEVIDFNVKDFFYSGEATEFGEAIQSTQLTYIMIYKSVLELGMPAVMGGEVLLTRHVSPENSFWYYTFRENEDASAMRFSNKYNIPLVNEYFSYTPELLLYYLECNKMKELVSTRFNYKLTSVSSKNAMLADFYDFRVKKKTHGFENLIAFNGTAYKEIGINQVRRGEPSIDGIPYDLAIAQLKGQI